MRNFTYCALDFETTGLSPQQDAVIEFGAVLFDVEGLGDEFSGLCNPGRKIPAVATVVNGITDDMVANELPFSARLEELLAFIGERVVVCHNAPFDMGFLNRYCREAGLRAPRQVMDTCQLSRQTFRQLSSFRLGAVANFLRIEQANAHRALDDAKVSAQIMIELIKIRS